MSTRSITIMIDKGFGEDEGERIATFYRQSDGYPSGHGQELADLLSGYVVGNGISLAGNPVKFANGAGCLFAQVLAHFKNDFGVGGIYLVSNKDDGSGVAYIYEIEAGYDAPITLTVKERGGNVLYKGTPEKFRVEEEEE